MPSTKAMFSNKTLTLLPMLVATLALTSCEDFRGFPSDKPPIHPVLDMDFEPKLRAQSEHEFEGWSDHRGARRPVADAFGTLLVSEAVTRMRSTSIWKASATTWATLVNRPWPISVPPWFSCTVPSV